LLIRLPALAAVLLIVVAAFAASTPRTEAESATTMSSVKLPFPAGTAWKVIQGYNGGTHVPGPEVYALDLVRDGGTTAGAEVLAPASGTLWFANPPGAGNGCMSIKMDGGGGLIVQMCHIILNRVMRPNEPIAAGASLGTVGADGRVGNNGVAHLHLSMHRTSDYGVTRVPAPFAAGSGLPLEGMNLPANGTYNQYLCPSASCPGKLVSTNSVSSAAPAPSPARPAPAPATAPAAAPLRTGVRAVGAGAGTGDCVNVRERPSLGANVRRCLPDGARLQLVEGPVAADGHEWWRLDGLGWSVSDYLSAVPATLEAGGRARVTAGRGDCLNLRAQPTKAARVIACLPDGTAVKITAGPREADGVTWWELDGNGWGSAEFLMAED
jgi:hypothetical protein